MCAKNVGTKWVVGELMPSSSRKVPNLATGEVWLEFECCWASSNQGRLLLQQVGDILQALQRLQ